jgi:hypothetical protein
MEFSTREATNGRAPRCAVAVCLGMDARVAENPQGRKGTEKRAATPPHMRVRVPWRRRPVWSVEVRALCVPAVTGSPEPQKQNLNEGRPTDSKCSSSSSQRASELPSPVSTWLIQTSSGS